MLLEICIESVEAAVAAAQGGAGRLELNTALTLDGLTPSLGLLEEVRGAVRGRVPVVAMARPRAGNFCYAPGEFRVLLRDVDVFLAHGADGIAFGVLAAAGEVDLPRCRQVARRIEAAGTAAEGAVFHRAFDATRDPFRALEQLIDLGVRRVMTGGGRKNALEGAATIAELARRARGRIEVLPAGGVRPSNAAAVLSRTGCDQLHASLRDRRTGAFDPRLLRKMVQRLGLRQPSPSCGFGQR